MLSNKLSKDLRLYTEAIRTLGGVVFLMLQQLVCCKFEIQLRKGWAKYFFRENAVCKRKSYDKG